MPPSAAPGIERGGSGGRAAAAQKAGPVGFELHVLQACRLGGKDVNGPGHFGAGFPRPAASNEGRAVAEEFGFDK